MRALNVEHFQKLAKTAVSEFVEKGTPLEDSVTKTAVSNELNPEQVRNLVQLANVMAHKMLSDKKDETGEDRIIDIGDFEPLTPSKIIEKVYSGKAVPCSEDSTAVVDSSDKILDFFGDLCDSCGLDLETGSSSEKIEIPGEKERADKENEAARGIAIIRIRKAAEYIDNESKDAAVEYRHVLDKVASEFAKLYGPSYEEFEKSALSWRGTNGTPVLNDIRSCLGLDSLKQETAVKIASVRRLVDTDTKLMQSFDQLLKLSSHYADLKAAREYLQQKVGSVL